MTVFVHPSKSNRVSEAILRELSSLLFKFNECFDGVLLAYAINELDKNAKILSGVHPYFGVKLKAKLLLFSPKVDMLIEGKVVKLTQDSIHLIVLGFSAAVITTENIREEFKYKIKHGEERFVSKSHKRHVIKDGTMLRFAVKSFDEEMLHIFGSLKPTNTGNIHWLYRNPEDSSLLDSSTNKRKNNDGRSIEQDNEAHKLTDNHVKKPKKHRIKEDQ